MSATIRLADYVAETLADRGVRQVFLVTGGGAMHLNDAFGRCAKLHYVCCHHEQACAMAAEAYARVTGDVGVVNVTTGPGSINALNGVFGAWTDSIPLLVVSGQVRRDTCLRHTGLVGKLRQLGDQEADIIGMVQGITKYAVEIDDPQSIRYHLERAWHLARTGRPGPVWLDIPIDVQGAQIDPGQLRGFDPAELPPAWVTPDLPAVCDDIVRRLAAAQRPVLLAGTGVRLAHAREAFLRVVGKLGIPVTTAWTHDLIASDDPHYCGRPGSIGDRAGNFTVQNSDVLLVIGARLNLRQISYNWKSFARQAFKIQVDVDRAELEKPTVRPDLPVWCDARAFLEALERAADRQRFSRERHQAWLVWCRARVQRYPTYVPERHRSQPGAINPYHFLHDLIELLADDDVIVCGNATACIVTFQTAQLKAGQRLFSNSGSASMGYDLPAAIGAAVARAGRRVICLAGDGSLQMNVQEFQTLAQHRWPVKVFVLNNRGYLSMRQTQSNFFGREVGAGPDSGVSFPDFTKVAAAYGLPARRIDQPDFHAAVRAALASPGPEVCEVILDPAQVFEPKTSSRRLASGRLVSAPLEDMAPFLSREELRENLLIPPAEES